jgi:hypothetical protein
LAINFEGKEDGKVNKDEFLQQDIKKAIAETRAAWTCIGRIEESILNGNLREAKLTASNLLSSLNELENLKDRKVKQDRLEELVHCLIAKGIKLEKVRRSI